MVTLVAMHNIYIQLLAVTLLLYEGRWQKNSGHKTIGHVLDIFSFDVTIDLSPKARHRTCWQTFSLWHHNQMARQVVAQLWRHKGMTSKGPPAAPHALNLAKGQLKHWKHYEAHVSNYLWRHNDKQRQSAWCP